MNKIAFIFPGQGSQYVGMGKTLYDNFPVAKSTFEEAEKVLGYDIKKVCFEGPFEKLTEPSYIQPAILVVSVAAYRVFEKEIGIKPDILLGHSFGGLTSLVCGGAIDFADALLIARLKGQYSEEAVKNLNTAMSVIKGVRAKKVRAICEKISTPKNLVVVGIVNSPNQVIISGQVSALEKAENELQKQGGTFERLRVKAPFHSALLNSAAKKIKKDLEKINFKKLKLPVLSAMSGEIYKSNEKTKMINDLSQSLSDESDWLGPVEKLFSLGIRLTIEIGPQKILTNLMPDITPDIETLTFNKFIDLESIKHRFGIDAAGKIEAIVRCLRVAVCVKNNNWNNEEYEAGVVKHYREIKNRLLEIRKQEAEPRLDDVVAALQMLDSVFQTKKISAEERKERQAEIFANELVSLETLLRSKKKLPNF